MVNSLQVICSHLTRMIKCQDSIVAAITAKWWDPLSSVSLSPIPELAPVTMAYFPVRSRPRMTWSAVLLASKRCLMWLTSSPRSSTANARRGSVYVVLPLMWLQNESESIPYDVTISKYGLALCEGNPPGVTDKDIWLTDKVCGLNVTTKQSRGRSWVVFASLVQIMACRLIGAKPLSAPILLL